jgi:hypothetical protein
MEGFQGLMRSRFEDDGMTLSYMSTSGWVDDPCLIDEFQELGTWVITAAAAAQIARARFDQPL